MSAPGPSSPDPEATAWAAETGRLIYEKDLAAARATDLLLSRLGSERDARLRGWITVRSGEHWIARFVGETAEGLVALYDVAVTPAGGDVTRHDPPPALSEREASMFRARQAAAEALPYYCSEDYNTVVVDGENGHWLVYLLAATRTPNLAVAGGHFRIEVAPTGEEVVAAYPLSDGCLEMSLEPPPGALMPTGLVLTHTLSGAPVETHTYLSLLHDLPIHVLTEGGVWEVDGATTEPVDCSTASGDACSRWVAARDRGAFGGDPDDGAAGVAEPRTGDEG